MVKQDQEFWRASRKVTLIGAALDAFLGISKIIVGLLAQSYSLLADGIHSLSDLVTDFMVLLITRFSRSSPDSDHPYGHARFETLATVLLGCVLLAVAVALAFDNLMRFINKEALLVPTWPALVVAAISIASKEWIYRYTARVAKDYKSDLLLANAWHSRSDALSSIVVFVGVAGAMLGVQWMDVLAALLVAAIIAKIAIGFIWQNIRQLVDEGLPPQDQKKILQLAADVEGVLGVHDLRSRLMGSDAFVEIHIQVAPWISVSEGHFIGNQVSAEIQQHMPDVADIVFHIDINDDDEEDQALPSRQKFLGLLYDAVDGMGDYIDQEKTALHYVDKRLSVDLHIRECEPEQLAQFHAQTNRLCKQHGWLHSIRIWR